MKHYSTYLMLLIALLMQECGKKSDSANPCLPRTATSRIITNKPAVVKVTATVNAVYLVEQGSIDTRLIPCNLPKEFLQNNLQVTISGDVKYSGQGAGPCCTENFVITKITR